VALLHRNRPDKKQLGGKNQNLLLDSWKEFISEGFFAASLSKIVAEKLRENVMGNNTMGEVMSNVGAIAGGLASSTTVSDTSFMVSLGKFGFDLMCELEDKHFYSKLYFDCKDVADIGEMAYERLCESQSRNSAKLSQPALKKQRLCNSVQSKPQPQPWMGPLMQPSCQSTPCEKNFTNYVEQINKIGILCVQKEEIGGTLNDPVLKLSYVLPLYSPTTGSVTSEAPIIYTVARNSSLNNECKCPLAVEARRMLSQNVPGYHDNKCHHERLLDSAAFNNASLSVKCRKKSGHFIVFDNKVATNSDTFIHVYVFSDKLSGRKKGSIVTVTPGNLTCSVCHNGQKQRIGDSNLCPHAELIDEEVLIGNTSCNELDDSSLIRKVFYCQRSGSKELLTFDTEKSIYVYDSLSSRNEDDQMRLGILPRPVPLNIDDVKEESGHISKLREATLPSSANHAYHSDFSVRLSEPIPSICAPCGQPYFNDEVKSLLLHSL